MYYFISFVKCVKKKRQQLVGGHYFYKQYFNNQQLIHSVSFWDTIVLKYTSFYCLNLNILHNKYLIVRERTTFVKKEMFLPFN